jgi:hypothetical protein
MAGRDTESRGCEGIALVGGLIKSTRQLLLMYGISRVRYPIAKKKKESMPHLLKVDKPCSKVLVKEMYVAVKLPISPYPATIQVDNKT